MDLTDGQLVGSVGADHVWSFMVDADDVAPRPETRGKFGVGQREPVSVQVLAVGDDSMMLSPAVGLGELADLQP